METSACSATSEQTLYDPTFAGFGEEIAEAEIAKANKTKTITFFIFPNLIKLCTLLIECTLQFHSSIFSMVCEAQKRYLPQYSYKCNIY